MHIFLFFCKKFNICVLWTSETRPSTSVSAYHLEFQVDGKLLEDFLSIFTNI